MQKFHSCKLLFMILILNFCLLKHNSCHPMALLPCSSLTYLSYYRPPLGAIALHSLFLYSSMPPSQPSTIRLAPTYCVPNLYLHKYPSNLIPVILLVHMTYEDGTVFRNIGTQNSEAGNHPKERIQQFVFVSHCVHVDHTTHLSSY